MSRAVVALLLLTPTALGQAPKSPAAYPFPLPPVEVIDRLAKADLGPASPLAGKERTAIEAVWKSRGTPQAKTLPQADAAAVAAHLAASGVADPKAAAAYAAKLDALTAKARKAVAGAENARVKADALLRFLHKETLSKGYAEDETTLPALFDTGKYNCVSSASLYFLVGTRLGLKLQPVRIPAKEFVVGHAACDLLDGKNRIQVEPTTPYGFDFAAKGHPPGVVVGYQPDRSEAVDTDGFGLASSTASNRGIGFSKSEPPQRAEAVRCYALALALDPTNETARKNLQAELVNWGVQAADAGRFEEAVKEYAFAATVLGPGVEALANNHRVIWQKYLDAEFAAGRYADGLAVMARAAKAIPDEKRFRTADDTRRLWSQDLLKKGNADGSLTVLADGLAADPTNETLRAGLAFHAQEALAALGDAKGPAAAAAHFQALREKFPDDAGVKEAGTSYAVRTIDRLVKDKKYDEAVKLATEGKALAGDKAGELTARTYDRWAAALAEAGRWEEAVARTADGLKAVPGDAVLANNGAARVDRWAAPAIERKDWKEAVRVYEAGLRYFPDSDHLKHNKAAVEQRLGK